MSKFGGVTTIMGTLDVGTVFYVHNGNWDGEIVDIDGVKHISVSEGRTFPLNDDYELDITVETYTDFKFTAYMGCACSEVQEIVRVPNSKLEWYGDSEGSIYNYVEKNYFKPWLARHTESHMERVL